MKQPKICERKRANGVIAYYCQIGSKQHGLGTDLAEAKKQFGELLANQKPRRGAPNPPATWVIDQFLAWSKRNSSAGTHQFYAGHLESFRDAVGRLTSNELKAHDVTRWLDGNYAGMSANYRHGATRAAKRSFARAVDQELIDRSPLARVKLPAQEHRELVINKAQWEQMKGLLSGKRYDDIRDYLTLIWETGCRPQEVAAMEAGYFDRENRRWVFPKKKSKGKKRQRVVYLTDSAYAITERLALKNPDGALFRTARGDAWDKNKVRCRFRRLKDKVGLPELCAYTLRHSWATIQLESGMDSHLVAKLMGHTTTRMLELCYGHVEGNPKFLSEQLNRSRSA